MNVKPGYKSTEFYASLAMIIAALLVTFEIVDPAEQESVRAAVTQLLTAVGALVSAAYVVARYIHGRTAIKLQALNSPDR